MSLIIDFILNGGIVITLLILFILIKSKKIELPQKLLLAVFVTLLSFLLNVYAYLNDIRLLTALTLVFNRTASVFLGPVIYIYLKSLFQKQDELIKKNWFHFIPTILNVTLLGIPLLISFFEGEVIFNYLNFFKEHIYVFFTVFMAHLAIYAVLSLKLFYQYRKAMKSNFSNLSEADFGWVKKMLYGLTAISFTYVGLRLYGILIKPFSWEVDILTVIMVVILEYYLGYYGIKQSKILLPDFLLQEEAVLEKSETKINYLASVSEEEMQNIESQLEKVLKEEKLYLDEHLTLNKLAQPISTTDKKLSTFINQHLNTNFYDLINLHRVEAVKEKIQAGLLENYSMFSALQN